MILPYASRGVLYAAKLIVGCSGRPLHSAAAPAGSFPHAESTESESTGARPSAANRLMLERNDIETPSDRTGT